MTAPEVHVVGGAGLEAHADALRAVYAEAFCAPPWDEDPARAEEFAGRLPASVRCPGFRAAVAVRDGEVLGFATARTTPSPFPADRCYPQAEAGLGAERTAAWLVGAREVEELAVRAGARGTGLAARLLTAVTADAPAGRCWLLTSVRAPRALSFYRRQGWIQATHPSPDGQGTAVFLGPRHPSRSLVTGPL
ncbi:GNAT family N-acetyltransferase [Streptomyces sp. LP11]|uniref:GNAT family N-acetyltransferase n=1 Tax=Streptomyces pyxinicus TaxID=2970331 RepID=A0ABT2B6U2_9ACTN|nr:GNAT family N-acetyltransferase [Streptomyces sp. LP11]MCS0604229.1 GNAT family N-acetyltransferase [Streptomyces sp. LP11]